MTLRMAVAFVVAMAAAAPAAAQPPRQSAPVQSIGAGTQWGPPSSGAHLEPGVFLSWTRRFSPRLGVEIDFRWASRNRTSQFTSLAFPSERGEEVNLTSSYAVGGAIVVRESIGRLSLSGGAGPGFFADRTRHERQIGNLRDASLNTVRTIGVLGLVDLNLRVTNRLSAFAGLRLEFRDFTDGEGNMGYPAAGVRFAF